MSKARKYLRVNSYQLKGSLKRNGYDWWWHSFTGYKKSTGEARAFFIEYFFINPSRSPNEVVYGQTSEHSHPSYFMVKAGSWGTDGAQIHNFYPLKDVEFRRKKEFSIKAGRCLYSEKQITGMVSVSPEEAANHPEYMSDAGSMAWNLKVNKTITFNPGYGTSWFFRKLNAFQMYWHAQGVKTEYTGTVMYNGEEYIVPGEESYGYADKNWGKDFTSPWLWLSSCNLVSEISGQKLKNTCFDVGGGCPRVFGIPLHRRLLVFLSYEGQKIEFNFSKFWVKSTVSFNFVEGEDVLHWSVSAQNKKYLLDIDGYCNTDEMLFVNYESPSGAKNFDRLWNGGTGYGEVKLFQKTKGNTLEIVEHAKFTNAGCEYGEYKKNVE